MSTSHPISHRRAVLRLAGVGVTLGLALALMGPALVAAGAPVTVETLAATYLPATITVEAGTKVIFKNTSVLPHTATADNGSFDTGLIGPGASKSVVMSQPGTFPFFCQYHGAAGGVGQSGTITVTAAAVGATPRPTKASGGGTTPAATLPSTHAGRDLSTHAGRDLPSPMEGLPLAAFAGAFAITILVAFGLDGAARAMRRRSGS